MSALAVCLCGLALRELAPAIMRKIGEKIGERAGEVIRDKIFPKKRRKAAGAPQVSQRVGVYGKIETRYPRLDGTANPWIMSTLYNKAYKSQPVAVEAEFEASRTSGAVILKISGIEESEVPPRIQVQGGVLTVYVPYGSVVDLETGDNFDAKAPIQAQLMFSSPITEVQDPYYRRGELVIPMHYQTPCYSITPIAVSPPKVVPPGVGRVDLPAGRKVDAFIPVIQY